jgi:hypothetical protein
LEVWFVGFALFFFVVLMFCSLERTIVEQAESRSFVLDESFMKTNFFHFSTCLNEGFCFGMLNFNGIYESALHPRELDTEERLASVAGLRKELEQENVVFPSSCPWIGTDAWLLRFLDRAEDAVRAGFFFFFFFFFAFLQRFFSCR